MKKILYLAAVLLFAAACVEPMSKETFQKGEGPYRFDVDMSDTEVSSGLTLPKK